MLLLLLGVMSFVPPVVGQDDQSVRVEKLRQRIRERIAARKMQKMASGNFPPPTAHNVSYGEDERQKLDVYAPHEHKALLPVVLFVHGGGWSMGNKRQHIAKGDAFAKHDVVCVCTNYRLAPNVMHPKQIEDIASAFAWVKTHIKEYGGNPDQIFVMGHSAGAQLVDLLATNDKYLAQKGLSLKDVKGVISLDTASLNLLERGKEPGEAGEKVGEMIETAFGHDRKTLIDASPTLSIHQGKTYPPFLMFCGKKRADARAAHTQFEKALRKVGGNVTVKLVPLSHRDISLGAGDEQSPVFKESLAFIQSH